MKEMALLIGMIASVPMLAQVDGKLLSPKEIMEVRKEKALENKQQLERSTQVTEENEKKIQQQQSSPKPKLDSAQDFEEKEDSSGL